MTEQRLAEIIRGAAMGIPRNPTIAELAEGTGHDRRWAGKVAAKARANTSTPCSCVPLDRLSQATGGKEDN